MMKCDVCGRTEKECKIRTIKSMNLCPKHITQWYRYGKFLEETIYDKNEYITYEDHAEIVLKDKNLQIVGYAIIDLEDVERCKQYKWHIRKAPNTNYVIAHNLDKNGKIQLHRFILSYNGDEDVDHINRNGLDNRKSNLRIVSHSVNLANQAPQRKGIRKVGSGNYQVVITRNYKPIYLGTYKTYEEALEARLNAEKTFGQ